MHPSHISLVLATPLLLVACTTANVNADKATLGQAVACCASRDSLPPPLPFQQKHELNFLPTSPHFDFGQGLAPFARITLDTSRATYVALLSDPRRGGSKLFGGDGTFYYADLRLQFVKASGELLPEPSLSPPIMKTYGALGTFMYVRYAAIPADAAIMILGTSTREAGRKGTISGNVPGGGFMLGSVFVPMPGGLTPFPFTLSPYGEAVVLFSTSPPTI